MAKILLVDDDQALLSIFETTFKKAGFEVITSNDGANGLAKAKSEKPDIILLDQVLPDISGNEVLKTIKQDPDTKDVPVAILSNFGQQELIQEAINQGAKDYILKYQIDPEDLVKKVNELLGKEKQDTSATQNSTSQN